MGRGYVLRCSYFVGEEQTDDTARTQNDAIKVIEHDLLASTYDAINIHINTVRCVL